MKTCRKLIIVSVISFCLGNTNSSVCGEYYLSLQVDIPLISAGAVSLAGGHYFGNKQNALTAGEISSSDRKEVNSFDRPATCNYSETSDKWSDYTMNVLFASPVLLAGFEEPRNDIFIIAVMYLESIALESGLCSIVKSTADRRRPYVYNDDVPLEKKTDKNSARSFYSGHTSSAFNSAVFLSTVFSDYYPDSDMRIVVWSASLLLASATGYLRYSAGMHFPSDIITGAAAGALTGYMVPALHRKSNSPLSVIPFITPGTSGVLVGYAF